MLISFPESLQSGRQSRSLPVVQLNLDLHSSESNQVVMRTGGKLFFASNASSADSHPSAIIPPLVVANLNQIFVRPLPIFWIRLDTAGCRLDIDISLLDRLHRVVDALAVSKQAAFSLGGMAFDTSQIASSSTTIFSQGHSPLPDNRQAYNSATTGQYPSAAANHASQFGRFIEFPASSFAEPHSPHDKRLKVDKLSCYYPIILCKIYD
ncbi:unnamed protein product [Protopolystoma xenopodis]|uniref:Uncharacterized protein n=1 Tax=Protopolystoma xenopodis TaxID=117903 RepID=A0A3S5CM90_9PLAT|nr:unnamed protein product [Protopolystoma xenopodis]